MTPPAVVINDVGAEVQFDGVVQWRIRWSQIREIAIEVTVVPELGYSEAFWNLSSGGIKFGVPVELVAGSEAFNARLLAFHGFDHEMYHRACEAEKGGKPGIFVCWREG